MPEIGPTNYSSQWSVENRRQVDCVLAGNPCSHLTWIQRPFVPFFPRVPITIPQSRVSQKTRKKKQCTEREREREGRAGLLVSLLLFLIVVAASLRALEASKAAARSVFRN